MKRGIVSVLALAVFVMGSVAIPAYAADKELSGKDKSFMKKAAISGMAEVEFGQLAQQSATAQEVKDFASRMVTDHTKANDELKALAQQKKYDLPKDLDRKNRSMLDKLKKKSGADFDKAYMKHMVKDHTMDVADFQKGEQKAKDPELKVWIGKTLPVLEEHLRLAREVAGKVGAEEKGKTKVK